MAAPPPHSLSTLLPLLLSSFRVSFASFFPPPRAALYDYLRARIRVRLASLPPPPRLSSLSLSLHPVSRSRERCCVRYIVYTSVPSLNKLLFIRPVAEMNLRDSYRTRPDMHDGFESLSFPPNVFSEVIDRRMNVRTFVRLESAKNKHARKRGEIHSAEKPRFVLKKQRKRSIRRGNNSLPPSLNRERESSYVTV